MILQVAPVRLRSGETGLIVHLNVGTEPGERNIKSYKKNIEKNIKKISGHIICLEHLVYISLFYSMDVKRRI